MTIEKPVTGKSWSLVADIGGTNARLAVVEDNRIVSRARYQTDGDHSLTDVFADFVGEVGSSPDHVEVAAAGLVRNGSVRLTNANQVLEASGLVRATGSRTARIINDFEAAAWSLVTAVPEDLTLLQGTMIAAQEQSPVPTGNRLIVGPGTGLGVGAQVWAGRQPHVVQGEGGHIRIAPECREHVALFDALSSIWPEVVMGAGFALEAEAIVSGTGLPFVQRALEEINGRDVSNLQAAGIFAEAKAHPDGLSSQAVELFCHYLGAVAGDLALTLSASGGVFLTGGVLQANSWIFDLPVFLKAFNEGGRHTPFREAFSVYLYGNGDFGLLGAMNAMRYQPLDG
ncbi:glucokinase [Kiloniella sp. b19]|uniref:glucokinase n=1 Tax=Kiloniella sp. GXU_MW_B19 TaxID=3141326 RepID=UPI0031DCA024